MNVTERTGKVVAILAVDDENDLVIINKSGITLRLHVSDLRIMGRNTQGVRLINLEKRGDEIASVCCVDKDDEAETEVIEAQQEEIELIEEPEEADDEVIEDDEIDNSSEDAPEE